MDKPAMDVPEPRTLQRSPLLVVSLMAAAGGASIYLIALPALWRLSRACGFLFSILGMLQVGALIAVMARPKWRRVVSAASTALFAAGLWFLQQHTSLFPAPNPWLAMDTTIGFTGLICAGLQSIAAFGLLLSAALGPRGSRRLAWRIFTSAALFPLVALVPVGTAVGVIGSSGSHSSGFMGSGFPFDAALPKPMPAGQMTTIEYCRPDGIPLAMDLYMPPAQSRRPAPVALYVHGGGPLGSRNMAGAGASLANHEGALFTPLRQDLNTQGFVVAAIDHRLPPATPWPGQIEDAKCAVRFLRAHAADLGIDPQRIGVWGSSGGGHLASMLGLTGPEDEFDRGQYLDQSSAVQAVVDMFGGTDINDLRDASPFVRFITRVSFGGSVEARRSASPIHYVNPDAPPFLILQGMEDMDVLPRQSIRLAEKLQGAGVPVSLIKVQGAGHGLNNPDQQPSPRALTGEVVRFFDSLLGEITAGEGGRR